MKQTFRIAAAIVALLLTPWTARAVTEADVTHTLSDSTTLVVPESMVHDFRAVLTGKYHIARTPAEHDMSEKVLVHGDTTAMVITERKIGRFDRGLSNWLFIPKNTWQFGLTASYGQFTSADLQLLDLLTDFDFYGSTFSIKPYLSFFIKDNFSLGMRIGYNNSKGNLDSMAFDFDDDLNFNVTDASYRSEALTAAIFARQFIGLARKGRFGVFNELELAFSSGNSRFNRLYDSAPKVTKTTYSDLRLNFSPGLTVFINPYVSFNVAFAVVGLYLRNEKQSVNDEYSGNRFTSGANFRFNLFNINFGLGVHL